jgi:hypothetical protein
MWYGPSRRHEKRQKVVVLRELERAIIYTTKMSKQVTKTKLGAEHPDTLTSMHNLAFTWRSLGRDAEAMASLQQCVELRQRVLGAGHPDLLSSQTALEQWEAEGIDEAEGEEAVEAE